MGVGESVEQSPSRALGNSVRHCSLVPKTLVIQTKSCLNLST